MKKHNPTHTPTPWISHLSTVYYMMDRHDGDSSDTVIASCIKREDAELIVRAVNSHEELIRVMREVMEWLNSKAVVEREDYKRSGFAHHVLKLEQAIAQAEGSK